jgi:hypothetical protein
MRLSAKAGRRRASGNRKKEEDEAGLVSVPGLGAKHEQHQRKSGVVIYSSDSSLPTWIITRHGCM